MKKYQLYTIIISSIWGWSLLTIIIYMALISGKSKIVVNFNTVGEMLSELILFPIVLINSIITGYKIMKEVEKNYTEY